MPAVPGVDFSPVKVALDSPKASRSAAASHFGMIRGVKNGASPKWLQQRLLAVVDEADQRAGERAQLHHLDRGRPLRVFDAAKVAGDLVHQGEGSETVLALDAYQMTTAAVAAFAWLSSCCWSWAENLR